MNGLQAFIYRLVNTSVFLTSHVVNSGVKFKLELDSKSTQYLKDDCVGIEFDHTSDYKWSLKNTCIHSLELQACKLFKGLTISWAHFPTTNNLTLPSLTNLTWSYLKYSAEGSCIWHFLKIAIFDPFKFQGIAYIRNIALTESF